MFHSIFNFGVKELSWWLSMKWKKNLKHKLRHRGDGVVCFCKNISGNIWIVAYLLLFLIFLLHRTVCKSHSISNGSLNVQQCRRNTQYFIQISPFQPQSRRKLGAFTSLWRVSANLVVLPMPHIQFLNTLQFLPNELFFTCQFLPRQSVISSTSLINIYNANIQPI